MAEIALAIVEHCVSAGPRCVQGAGKARKSWGPGNNGRLIGNALPRDYLSEIMSPLSRDVQSMLPG